MPRIGLALLAVITAFPQGARDGKPDFSGTWTMDPARSESAHQGLPLGSITLVIQQSPSDVSVETRRSETEKAAASTETLTYRLDGSELSLVGRSDVPVRTRARWEGRKLVTETARTIHGAAVTLLHVLSLDSAGKVLTIDKTLTVQHGYQATGGRNSGSGKDVFVRAKAAPAK